MRNILMFSIFTLKLIFHFTETKHFHSKQIDGPSLNLTNKTVVFDLNKNSTYKTRWLWFGKSGDIKLQYKMFNQTSRNNTKTRKFRNKRQKPFKQTSLRAKKNKRFGYPSYNYYDFFYRCPYQNTDYQYGYHPFRPDYYYYDYYHG
jgi:hypothetical protein